MVNSEEYNSVSDQSSNINDVPGQPNNSSTASRTDDNLALLGHVDPMHVSSHVFATTNDPKEPYYNQRKTFTRRFLIGSAICVSIAAFATAAYFIAATVGGNHNTSTATKSATTSSSSDTTTTSANTPASTFDQVLSLPDTPSGNTTSARYTAVYTAIVSSGLTTNVQLLQPGSTAPQRMALRWIVYGDPAKPDPNDPSFLDRYALTVFFFSTQGPKWNTNSKWVIDPNVCTWVGIQCDQEQQQQQQQWSGGTIIPVIKSLSLPKNNLNGPLPSEVFLPLQNATVISLFTNQLQGTIPAEIGSLEELATLALFNNTLVGQLPTAIQGAKNLVNLLLAENELEGTVPSELGSLTQLEQLHLYDNKFYGTLPSDLTQLTRMKRLWLSQNRLYGNFPPNFFSSMRNLEALYLDQNFFTGPITVQSGLFSALNLEDIRIYKNAFSGTIPSEFGLMSKLKLLYLDQNSFDGSIPESLGQLSNLRELSLFTNRLQGTVPESFGQLQSLQVIDVGDNDLTGIVPSSFQNLRQLHKLRLYKNGFTGAIPDLSDCPNLDDLEVQKNLFSGIVPLWLGNLPKLTTIVLSSNQFVGSVPSSLSKLNNLEFLRLQDNLGIDNGAALQELCSLSKPPAIIVDYQIQCTCCSTCLVSPSQVTTVSSNRLNMGT